MNKKKCSFLLSLFCGTVLIFTNLTTLSQAQMNMALQSEAQGTLDKVSYLPLVRKDEPPPQIDFFTANVTIADPGDTISLSWQTTHATTNTLYHLLATGQFGTFWNVTTTGKMTYTIPSSTRNFDRFVLFAGNNTGPHASAFLSIELRCPYDWFFSPAPDVCAQDAAQGSAAAEQPFEHGTMIWVQEEDRIYVLFADDSSTTKWSAFTDEWDPGEPIDDPSITPPAGLYQPIQGFGLVWRTQPTVRDRLGWATAPESGFVTAVQHTSYAKYNDIFMRALDGNVWKLGPEHSSWEKIIPES